MLALGFAELLGGGLLLTSAITGHSLRDVLAGRASPIRGLIADNGQASSGAPGGGFNLPPGLIPDADLSPWNGIDPGAGGRGFQFNPGADRPGVPTDPVVRRFASMMSMVLGRKVVIGTGSAHSQMTASGNVSDHWTGRAMDIPATGAAGDAIAAAALMLCGYSPSRARATARGGGIHNITPTAGPFKGVRIQIIWRAADHHDHVHVGFNW